MEQDGEVVMVQVNEKMGLARAMVNWDDDDGADWVDLDQIAPL